MQVSTGEEASMSVFRSGENVLGLSLKKDELFENGEKEDESFDMSSQLVLQQRSHSGPSESTRCCLKILSNLRKSDDDYLATVFHRENTVVNEIREGLKGVFPRVEAIMVLRRDLTADLTGEKEGKDREEVVKGL